MVHVKERSLSVVGAVLSGKLCTVSVQERWACLCSGWPKWRVPRASVRGEEWKASLRALPR